MREVPPFGDRDIDLAAFLADLSDDEVLRLTGALIGMLYKRSDGRQRFAFKLPLLGLEFHVEVADYARGRPGVFYQDWPDTDSPAPDKG